MTAAIPDALMKTAGMIVADVTEALEVDIFTAKQIDAAATVIARALQTERNRATEAERNRDRWQPIETAPTEEVSVLVWDGNTQDVAWVGWEDSRGPVWFNGDVVVEPTHWQPLPTNPSNPAGE